MFSTSVFDGNAYRTDINRKLADILVVKRQWFCLTGSAQRVQVLTEGGNQKYARPITSSLTTHRLS